MPSAVPGKSACGPLKGIKLGNWPRTTPAGLAAATVVGAVAVVGAVDEHAASSGNVTASALWRRNVRRLSAVIPVLPPLSSVRRACYTRAIPTYRVLYTDRG